MSDEACISSSRIPQGPDTFMSLFAVGALAACQETLPTVARRLLATSRVVCCLVDNSR